MIQAPQIFIGYLMMQILTATFWPVLNSSTFKNRRFDPFRFLKKLFITLFFIVWTKNLDLFWVNTGLDKALQPGYNWFGSVFFYFHSNWLLEDCFKFITIQNHVDEHCSSYNLFVKHDFGEWSMFGRPIQRLNTSYSFLKTSRYSNDLFLKTLNQLRRLNQVVPDFGDESVGCNLSKIGRKIAWKVRTVMWTVSIRYLAMDMYIIGHF